MPFYYYSFTDTAGRLVTVQTEEEITPEEKALIQDLILGNADAARPPGDLEIEERSTVAE